MIYIYRPASSTGARELANALHGKRWRRETPRLRPGDCVVAWGARLAPINGVRILNGGPMATKYEDAIKLKQEKVPTIKVSLQAGFTEPPGRDPRVDAHVRLMQVVGDMPQMWANSPAYLAGLETLMREADGLRQAIASYVPRPVRVWLPRRNHHVGGADLLTRCPNPDYYALQEDLVREFRVHSFLGRSLRAGVKIPREGVTPHEWVRSWDGGWRISYDGHSSTEAHRKLARKAVKALGLDFGAVDIGEKRDGSLIVLEVNRAPGLEGGTIDVYRDAITEWVRGARREAA